MSCGISADDNDTYVETAHIHTLLALLNSRPLSRSIAPFTPLIFDHYDAASMHLPEQALALSTLTLLCPEAQKGVVCSGLRATASNAGRAGSRRTFMRGRSGQREESTSGQ